MADSLVECMGADADRSPAQVELAHVDGIERCIPGFLPSGKDVRICDRIVTQGVLGDIILAGSYVLQQG